MNGDDVRSWKDLLVWQKAHSAALTVHREVREFPADERYRVTDQLCRAAVSVPTNIAEGKGRGSPAEFRQFLFIARGSTEETRYLLLLARDLGFLPDRVHSSLETAYTEISKMLNALIRKLRP